MTHQHFDRCRTFEADQLRKAALAEDHLVLWPYHRTRLPFVEHVCGPHCAEPDLGGPVIQGRRDPVTLKPLEAVEVGTGS